MSNTLAISLGVLLIGAVLGDAVLTGGATLTMVGKAFLDIIDQLRFWS